MAFSRLWSRGVAWCENSSIYYCKSVVLDMLFLYLHYSPDKSLWKCTETKIAVAKERWVNVLGLQSSWMRLPICGDLRYIPLCSSDTTCIHWTDGKVFRKCTVTLFFVCYQSQSFRCPSKSGNILCFCWVCLVCTTLVPIIGCILWCREKHKTLLSLKNKQRNIY